MATPAIFDDDGNFKGGTILEHVNIEYGGHEGSITTTTTPSILLDATSPFFNYVSIKYAKGKGIVITKQQGYPLKINNTIISDCMDYAIHIAGQYELIFVDNCTILNNQGGGIATESYSNAVLHVRKSTLYSNGYYGIYMPQGNLSVTNCNISKHVIAIYATGGNNQLDVFDSYFGENSDWTILAYYIQSLNVRNTLLEDSSILTFVCIRLTFC